MRVSTKQKIALAVDELARLGSRTPQLDIVPGSSGCVDLKAEGLGALAEVIAYDAAGEALGRHLLATEARGAKIVVANRISRPAQALLSDAGWSWYDRRVGARIVLGKHVFHLPPERPPASHQPRAPEAGVDGPIRGRAGIAYAAALLCTPEDPPSLRSVAAEVGMSPTSISNAAKVFVDVGLVVDGKPALPDLFWALAAVWRPLHTVAVATRPDRSGRALQTNADRLDDQGWALAGDLAALELGAPLFAVEDGPSFWVPTQLELRRAERHLGSIGWAEAAAVLSVPPTPVVTHRRRPPVSGDWPLPHPVFAALDLATAAGRGREILNQWQLEGVDAVWRG